MSDTTKVTYATLTADNEELHAALDGAIDEVRRGLGRTHPLAVGGEARSGRPTFESRSPIDTRVVLGNFQSGIAADVNDAVALAHAAGPAWEATPWRERADILDRAAALIRERLYELTAWLVLENGKNRVEALGEVEETADLILYYSERLREAGGFTYEMSRLDARDTNTSVMRAYGVWAVISPWNFPYALLGAPAAAALLAGNTVVMKPASETPMSGVLLLEIFRAAGVPDGAIHLVTGSGSVAGRALVEHPRTAGLTFTGSYDVGFHRIYRTFAARYPKPCITEMGGKNPAIVMESADLARAVSGVHRSAFGMGGQKCSACSRVYVHEDVAAAFASGLAEAARATTIGNPLEERGVFMGPLSIPQAVADYERFVEMARSDGEVMAGGRVLRDGDLAHGYFVEPTVVRGLPEDHPLVRDELFVPLVCVQSVKSLDEALERANASDYGLTAGFFSTEQEEIDAFLARIQAGVVYVNRAAGATTGAWPGVQPFGGWKGSGSTGKNIGGPHTLGCYLREQSRTVTE
ncbi:MAG TPA: aldehyde dehydrogenase family protein [Longimicrobiales bacterium]|nr:aldehyde dehydrogenase family protein [Longimicrobiales bacterium]